MTTKIEQVARAILKARFYDCEPDMYDSLDAFYAEIDAEHWESAHIEAGAAIEAMRDATEYMRAAGTARDDGADRTNAVGVWEAMIDAALKEEG